MSLSPPTVKHTGQESAGELCEIFQILIVSAVKNCKQRLQTASVSGGPDPLPGLCSWTPLGDFRLSDPLG